MNNVDTENDRMLTGIKQLLGIVDYDGPVRAPEPCVHESDGYYYNVDMPESRFWLFQCRKCGIQYEEMK